MRLISFVYVLVEALVVDCATCTFFDEPPPDAVPVVTVPLEDTNTFPDATSDATAVTTEQSSNLAVPLPDGTTRAGTLLYVAPQRFTVLLMADLYEMLKILVWLSWLITGIFALPFNPHRDFPDTMFAAT